MRLNVIVIQILVLLPRSRNFELLLPEMYNSTDLYTIPCITKLFEKYFTSGEPLTGSALLVSIDESYSLVQEYILKNLNNNDNYGWTVIIQNSKTDFPVNYASLEKVKNYLIFFDYADDVEEVIEDWKSMPSWNSLAQLLIVFSTEQHPVILEANVRNLIRMLQKNYIYNANVLSQVYLENAVQVSTYYPYEADSCSDGVDYIKVIDLCEFDDCVDFTLRGDNVVNITEFYNVFNGRLPDYFHQCPLRIQAKAWEPYTVYDKENGFVGGIDVMLVRTIADQLNMSAQITLQNTSTYHVYQQLIEHEIDMIIGGVSEDPGMSDLLSSSFPYYQDDITWCVLKAGRLLQWMSFLALFDLAAWILIFIVLLMTSGLTFSFFEQSRKKVDFFLTFLSISALLLGQSFNFVINKFSIRMLFFFIFCFCHVINTAYQSFLISSLTHPETTFQVTTTQQIVQQGMDISGGIDVVQYLNKKGKIYEYLQRKISICQDMEICVEAVTSDPNLAVAISRENAFYNPNIPRDKLFCFSQSENIYSYLVSILVPKDYHLLGKINNVVQQVIESGHIVKWTRELNNNITLKEERRKNAQTSDLILNTEQVKGPFILWTICMSIALCVFGVELKVDRMTATRSKKRIWRILDNLLYLGKRREYLV